MNIQMLSVNQVLRTLALFLGLATMALACSDEQGDPCADITCELGVCDSTGRCANAGFCEEDVSCLDGFRCLDGNCFTDFPCSESGLCDRGICVDGACLNPGVCVENQNCLPGHACKADVCEPDACIDVVCERGVCDVTTSECVNEVVCTEATEDVDCIDGHYCYGASCTPAETVCADISCSRGVCDASTRSCVDAETCASDRDCSLNSFCDDENSCQLNVCDQQRVSCLRGVCNVRTTACENKNTCSSRNDCIDGFNCLGGSCVPQGEECGIEGCPGNQVCDVIASSQSAICIENPGGCGNALDCRAGRVCRSGRCEQPISCEADSYEPNDTIATDFMASATSHVVNASICRQDVDLFEFDTTLEPEFTGLLVIDVAYSQFDVGLGALRLELLDSTGTVIATEEGEDGVLRIEHSVTAVTRGVYTARVSDPATLGPSGIRYSLFMDLMEPTVAAACLNAAELTAGVQVSNNSASGDSYEYGSTCTSPDNPAGENIYYFEVLENSLVTLDLNAANNVDLSLAVRTRCESLLAEVACIDPPGPVDFQLEQVFVPGTYFVIVQGVDVGGAYTLELSTQATICTRYDNSCVDADTSRSCRLDGTGYILETCANGCDSDQGSCERTAGDRCDDPINVFDGYNATFNFGDFKNDFDPAFSTCVPGGPGQTAGPDIAFFVEVPDQNVLDVNLTRTSGDDLSLYILTDCDNPATCTGGVNLGATANERLIHINDSGATESFFVIVDVEASSSYGDVTVDVATSPVVCVAGSFACNGDTLETCNSLGTVLDSQICSAGCASGQCNPVVNDECAGAIDITVTGSALGRIEEYSSDYTPGYDGCTGRSAYGLDATYLINPPAGEVVTIDLIPTFDASLWVTSGTSCTAAACVAGSDETGTGSESVQFVADGGTYTIIVDATSSSVKGTFTLLYATQLPSCTPGAVNGCNAGTISYCGDLGLPASYACQGGTCAGAACSSPTGDLCIDALPVTSGTHTGDFTGTNSINTGVGTSGACSFPSGEVGLGAETIYAIDLGPGEWLFANLDSESSSTIMYLLENCADADSCLVATREDDESQLAYQSDFGERVYLVVDRTSSSTTSLGYEVVIDVRSSDCTTGSPSYCDTDGVTLKYCDFRGFLQDYTCDGTCSASQCDTPTGDSCVDTVVLTSGVTMSGNITTSTTRNNYVQPLTPLDGLCAFDSSYGAVGREDIYSIDVLPGTLIEAELSAAGSNSYVYILEDCLDTSTCKANNHRRGNGTVRHTSLNGGTYFVVVDMANTYSSGSYDITVNLTPGKQCTPNETQCGTNGDLEVCDPTGSFVENVFTCANGCDHGRCIADSNANTCALATNIGTGISVFGSFADYTNDIDLTSSDCVGRTTPGPDLMYAVSLAPGEVLRADLKSYGYEDPILYVVSDCQNPAQSCRVGQGPSLDDDAEVYYMATGVETVYVVADGTSSSHDELFGLTIEVLPQQCSAPYSICADSQTLSYCNEYGLFDQFRCDGGCSQAACTTPSAEICQDAIPLANGQSFSGSYADFANDTDPGSNSCVSYSSDAQDGPDAHFRVSLQAGDLLEATLNTSTSTSGLYILDACEDPSGSCLLAEVNAKSLKFVAPVTQEYYLVVDSDSATLTSSFDIAVSITPGFLCTPGESTCVAGIQNICDQSGYGYTAVANCSNGCAQNEYCAPPTSANDTCADVMVITGSTRILDRYERFANDFDPGSSSCAGGATTGPDSVYQVSLSAGDVLQVALTPMNPYDDPRVYIVSDCQNPDTTCLDGDAATDSTASAGYVATQSETVFVIADSSSSSDRDAFILDFDIRPPECVPNTVQCSGDVLLTCNAIGFFDASDCYFGCAGGVCNPTPNDLCTGAIDVGAGGTFRAPIAEYTAVYNTGAGANTSCSGGNSLGREAVYKMNLNQGDFVDLKLASTSDAVLWVSTSCADSATVADSCIAGVDDPAPEKLSFYAPSTQTYFIYADLYSSAISTGFLDLEVNIQPANTCTAATCQDASTISYCDDGGTVLRTDTCVGGCSAGECGAPTGEWCGQAIDATAGGVWSVNMDSMKNDYQFNTDVCFGASAGNDLVFRVDLQANDLLDIGVVAPSGENPKIALISDCTQLNNDLDTGNCFASNDVTGSTETLVYQATSAETVFILIDAASSTVDDGIWDISIFAGQPICSPGTSMCIDSTDLGICNATGTGFAPFGCQGGCSNGACGTPSAEVCLDAKPLANGAMEPGDYAGTNDADLGTGTSGSCSFLSSQAGTDHFYYVDLLAGETLTASFTTTSGYGILYLTSDCSDGNACLANTSAGGTGSATYTATGPERVYVVMDRTLSGSTSSYDFTVSLTVQ